MCHAVFKRTGVYSACLSYEFEFLRCVMETWNRNGRAWRKLELDTSSIIFVSIFLRLHLPRTIPSEPSPASSLFGEPCVSEVPSCSPSLASVKRQKHPEGDRQGISACGSKYRCSLIVLAIPILVRSNQSSTSARGPESMPHDGRDD